MDFKNPNILKLNMNKKTSANMGLPKVGQKCKAEHLEFY